MDRRSQIITLTAEGITLLEEMEASFGHWPKRLVQELGTQNVRQTIEHPHELMQVLDADAGHFEAGQGPALAQADGPDHHLVT